MRSVDSCSSAARLRAVSVAATQRSAASVAGPASSATRSSHASSTPAAASGSASRHGSGTPSVLEAVEQLVLGVGGVERVERVVRLGGPLERLALQRDELLGLARARCRPRRTRRASR